jgi:hypothetical protein
LVAWPLQNLLLGVGHRVDDLGCIAGHLPDQDRTCLRLDVIELLVERGRRNVQALFRSLIGGVDGTANARGDRQHQRNDLREEQLLDVLPLPGDLEDLIEPFPKEQPL